MGKKKLPPLVIENWKERTLTFYKRRKGLLKKAMELSTLCDVNVLMLVFDPKMSKVSVYSSIGTTEIIQRFTEMNKECVTHYEPYIDIRLDVDDQNIAPLESNHENRI